MSIFPGLYKDERTALFIDGTSLYKSARNLGFDIDYRNLLATTRNASRLLRASYYTTIQEDRDQDYSPLRPLVDWLEYNGYTMTTKVMRDTPEQNGRKRFRVNTDVELAVDMVLLSSRLDHIVLFSGNGDFRRAIEAVQEKGVRVTAVSTVRSSTPMASDDLRRQADVFIDLADLEGVIGRRADPGSKRDRHAGTADELDYDDDTYMDTP